MATILRFLPDQDLSEPQDLPAMAAALDDILERLEREGDRLRDRVHEANAAARTGLGVP